MSPRTLAPIVLLALGAVANAAAPRGRIDATVVDVAGGRAYLTPGAAAGVRRGATATFARRPYVVVDVTEQGAVVELASSSLRPGERGTVDADAPEAAAAAAQPLPRPPPLEHYRDQWKPARRPAETQHPQARPLGPMRAPGAFDLRVWLGAATAVGEASVGRFELGTRSRWEGWREAGVDLDASGFVWLEGGPTGANGRTSRPIAEVRELRLRWGSRDAPLLSGGRLRWAAAHVGPLDGGRAAWARGPLTLAVFGGVVPDPRSLEPDADVARVGIEARWDDLEGRLRPSVALDAWGSHFDGAIDERRLAIGGRLEPGPVTLGADAEVAAFDDGDATGVELAHGGAELLFGGRSAHAAARVAYDRPERSRHLDALFGPGWSCTPRADGGCDRRAQLALALDAGVTAAPFAVFAGAAAIRTLGDEGGTDASAFTLARFAPHLGRRWLELGASGTRGELVDQASAQVGLGGRTRDDTIDVGVRYRPVRIAYRAGGAAFLEHHAAADAAIALDPLGAEVVLGVEGITSEERREAFLFALLAWRGP